MGTDAAMVIKRKKHRSSELYRESTSFFFIELMRSRKNKDNLIKFSHQNEIGT